MTMATTGTAKVTLPSDEQILITRDFDAPKHLVYKAWTTPELVKRWWSGGMGNMTVADIDLRVGGRWRHVIGSSEHGETAFHGDYLEIIPNERIVTTEVYEMPTGLTEAEPLNVIVFIEKDGRTTLSLLVQCASKATRDAIMDSGMEVGMQKSYDMLEQVAASLA